MGIDSTDATPFATPSTIRVAFSRRKLDYMTWVPWVPRPLPEVSREQMESEEALENWVHICIDKGLMKPQPQAKPVEVMPFMFFLEPLCPAVQMGSESEPEKEPNCSAIGDQSFTAAGSGSGGHEATETQHSQDSQGQLAQHWAQQALEARTPSAEIRSFDGTTVRLQFNRQASFEPYATSSRRPYSCGIRCQRCLEARSCVIGACCGSSSSTEPWSPHRDNRHLCDLCFREKSSAERQRVCGMCGRVCLRAQRCRGCNEVFHQFCWMTHLSQIGTNGSFLHPTRPG